MSDADPTLQPAAEGSGTLLERDYWAVIAGPRLTPHEVADAVARHFERFAPAELVVFRRRGGGDRPLEVGDEMDVEIRHVGTFGVRVVHRDELSLTLATLEGHPEAGRITFGAYPDAEGAVVFHIRSRARASSGLMLASFLAAGEPMQTSTWSAFVERVASSLGKGVRNAIHAETREVEEGEADRAVEELRPTYRARDDRAAEDRSREPEVDGRGGRAVEAGSAGAGRGGDEGPARDGPGPRELRRGEG